MSDGDDALDCPRDEERDPEPLGRRLQVDHVRDGHRRARAHQVHHAALELEVVGAERRKRGIRRRCQAGHEPFAVEREQHGLVGHPAVGGFDAGDDGVVTVDMTGPAARRAWTVLGSVRHGVVVAGGLVAHVTLSAACRRERHRHAFQPAHEVRSPPRERLLGGELEVGNRRSASAIIIRTSSRANDAPRQK